MNKTESNVRILVTGASGYIGLHCIADLIKKGYEVSGTIRSKSRKAEIEEALSLIGLDYSKLRLHEADLNKEDGWDEAFQGITHVLHVASPFPLKPPKDPNDLLIPAIEGTKRILTLAKKFNVKKVVLTSSTVAVYETYDGKTEFDENDWSKPDKQASIYGKSKTLAEQTAWDFVKKEKQPFDFTTILPAAVFGPSLSQDIGSSNRLIQKMIDGELPGCPKIHIGYVHVEDVATAHVKALFDSKTNGLRIMLAESSLWVKDVCHILREAGFNKAPKRELPNLIVKFAALFDQELAGIKDFLGLARHSKSKKAQELLGLYSKTAQEAILETANDLTKKKV